MLRFIVGLDLNWFVAVTEVELRGFFCRLCGLFGRFGRFLGLLSVGLLLFLGAAIDLLELRFLIF